MVGCTTNANTITITVHYCGKCDECGVCLQLQVTSCSGKGLCIRQAQSFLGLEGHMTHALVPSLNRLLYGACMGSP